MAELMNHVTEIAENIGPRPVSTEEENLTSNYVAEQFEANGFDVDIDEFATPTGVKWPFAIAYAAMILGTIISGLGIFAPELSTTMYALGLLLLVISLAIYFTERLDKPILSKLLVRGVSQNVVARYVPSSVARERRRRKVIIVAHVDTVRAEPEAAPFIINKLPLIKNIVYYVMIGLAVVFFVRMLPLPLPDTVDFVLWIISLVACVIILAALVCILVQRFMPYVSGGNDNASSLAVMLEMSRLLMDPEARENYANAELAEGDEADEEFDEYDDEYDEYADEYADEYDEYEDEEAVQHSAEEAYAAGLVPEGAEIEYEDDYADDEYADDYDDEYADEEPAAGETQVMRPVAAAEAEPVAEVEPEPEPQAEAEPEPAAAEEVPPGGAWPVPGVDYDPEAAEEPEPSYPSIFEPIPEPEPLPVSGLPAWYTAAKQKASQAPAEEGEEKTFRGRFADMPVRGRVERAESAPAPQPAVAAQPEPVAAVEAAPEPEPEPQAVEEKKPTMRRSGALAAAMAAAAEHAAEFEAAPEPQAEPEQDLQPVAEAEIEAANEPAAEPEAEQAVLHLDIFDDDLADLDPDSTGTFSVADAAPAARPAGLTGLIPTISVDDAAPADEQASDELEPLTRSQIFPAVKATAEPEVEATEPAAEPEPAKAPTPKRTPRRKPAPKPAAAKAEPKPRAKPTARRVTEKFEPTKARRSHDDAASMLNNSHQRAAVNSTYEGTPQGGPQATQAFDPFAPKGDPAADASLISPEVSTQFQPVSPALSSQFAAVDATEPAAGKTGSFPSLTGSFPSLTGSFPSLTGSFPTLGEKKQKQQSMDDFDFSLNDEPYTYGAEEDDFAAFENFGPDTTSEIHMPNSRMHGMLDGARDGVGGLFSKFGRKKKQQDDAVDSWGSDDDDDFGWKGGGYMHSETENARKAARDRAAQIREAVVQMTEEDLLDKEVWFVALGASNGGQRGMKNFLELHRSELRGALLINLEGIGAGDICFVDYEGDAKTIRSDRRLQSLVRNASKELDGEEMPAERLNWRDTDATPALKAGLRAMTIMGFDGVAPTGWHWSSDTADIVNEDKMEYTIRLLLKMIENS